MPIISISLPEQLLRRMDEYIALYGFVGRSEFVREAVRRFIESLEVSKPGKTRGYWVIIVLTEHAEGYTAELKVIEIIHRFQPMVRAFYHQLLGDKYCLNIAVLEATTSELSVIVNSLRRAKNVVRVWFTLIGFEGTSSGEENK